MKMRLLGALIGLATSFALPTFAQQTNAPDPQLREEIVALLGKFTEAWNNNDAAALAALYTKDAVFCGGEGSGPHYGREAIEKHFAEGFNLFHFSDHVATPDQYSPHVVGMARNEVWAFGDWSMTIQSKNGGSPMQIRGNWGDIFVREGDDWKAKMVVSNNAPTPPEPAQTNAAPTSAQEKPTPAAKFAVGDWVSPRTGAIVNVRPSPAGAPPLGTHTPGDTGQVKAGPTPADWGTQPVNWYQIAWQTDPKAGWSGDADLEGVSGPGPSPSVTPSPTPTPTPNPSP